MAIPRLGTPFALFQLSSTSSILQDFLKTVEKILVRSSVSAIEYGKELDVQEERGAFQKSKRQLSPDVTCERRRVKTAPP